MPDVNEKKPKKFRELFVEELARVQGGKGKDKPPKKCPEVTTLACGEENGCSGC